MNVLAGETVNLSESVCLGSLTSPPNITYQTSGNNTLNYADYIDRGVTISYDEYWGFYSANVKFDLKIDSILSFGVYDSGYAAYEFYNGSWKIIAHRFNYISNVIDPNTIPPSANFITNTTSELSRLTVTFADRSEDIITE